MSGYFTQDCRVCGRPLRIMSYCGGRIVVCQHCRGRFVARDPAGEETTESSTSDRLLRRADQLLEMAGRAVAGSWHVTRHKLSQVR